MIIVFTKLVQCFLSENLLLWCIVFHSFVLFKDFFFQLFFLSAQIVDFVSKTSLLLVKVLLVVHGLGQQVVVLRQQQGHLKNMDINICV